MKGEAIDEFCKERGESPFLIMTGDAKETQPIGTG